jgi:hypothetical protein
MARARRSAETVRVQGLDDLRRELRKIQQNGGPQGSTLLKEANHKVASHVVSRAQGRAASVGRMQSKAAATLRAGRAQARATVTGGTGVPYFYGAEFGAYAGVSRTRGARTFLGFNQFLQWKAPGNGNTGYFLYPTMKAESATIIEMYGDELDKITDQAFPN